MSPKESKRMEERDIVDAEVDSPSAVDDAGVSRPVGSTEINNGFLWIVALVPLAWVLQMLFFVAVPLDCTLGEAFALGEYITDHAFEDPLLWKLYWPSVVWAIGVDTLFFVLDDVEVRKRGFGLGGRLRKWTAYLVPPLYVWVRGDPSLNGGSRKILPYVTWWTGTVVVLYFESGWLPAAVASAVAFMPWAIGVVKTRFCRSQRFRMT